MSIAICTAEVRAGKMGESIFYTNTMFFQPQVNTKFPDNTFTEILFVLYY